MDEATLAARLTAKLAATLELDPAAIEPDRPFWDYGLDSLKVLELVVAIEDWLGQELPMETVWQHPSVDSLSAFLAHEKTGPGTPRRAEPQA